MAWTLDTRVGNFNVRSIDAQQRRRANKKRKQQANFDAQLRDANKRGVKVQEIPYRHSAGTPQSAPKRDIEIARLEHEIARLQAYNAAILANKSNDFYQSPEWFKVRYEALKRTNGCCELCGISKAEGAIIQVDHIKPRSRFPHLELDIGNLQVLCKPCNMGKSNRDTIDWRTPLKVVSGN